MKVFYTSLDDAKVEIQKRWQNENLKKEIISYFGVKLPNIFSEPRAILVRNIATPDIECMYFVWLSQLIGLSPIVFEGTNDKFVSIASDKMGLVKMSFFDGYDKNNDVRHHYRKVIDISKNDGKKFSEISTLWGEKLVEFHHRLLYKHINKPMQIFDDLMWYESEIGGSVTAKDYYKILFAFFVAYGVQFENYVTDTHEQEFFYQVVQPAFDFIERKFGVRPLIVKLAPHNEASNPFWWCYYDYIEADIIESINKIYL